jgi:hypothetical protein
MFTIQYNSGRVGTAGKEYPTHLPDFFIDIGTRKT